MTKTFGCLAGAARVDKLQSSVGKNNATRASF